jgi:hypothetical protein
MRISTRKARKLRVQVTHTITARRNLDAHLLSRKINDAEERIASLKERLTPGYRLNLTYQLAKWEAHLDSLEDCGDYAVQKGQE